MNNLIYTICDNNYKSLLPYWVNSIKKFNKCDILIICTDDFSTDLDVKLYKDSGFDYKFLSKFVINDYPEVVKYDNFLFLDLDILCTSNLDEMFKIINKIDIIHGVKEKTSILQSDHFHRFLDMSHYNIGELDCAYNAGTFGFNKNVRKIFVDFINFINKNKDQLCDQPIFNVFFNHRKLIQPSLSEFVFLDKYDINVNPIEKCSLIHFLGNYGNINNKIDRIKKYVKN